MGTTHQRKTADIGLMDYRARFYSPALGRFTQPDTIVLDLTNSQAWNRYAYVNNSPIMYVDPSGHYMEQACGFGGGECGTEGELSSNTDSSSENLKLDMLDELDRRQLDDDETYEPKTYTSATFTIFGYGFKESDDIQYVFFKPPTQGDIINGTTYNFAYPEYTIFMPGGHPAIYALYLLVVVEEVVIPLFQGPTGNTDTGNIMLNIEYENYHYNDSNYVHVTSVSLSNMSEITVRANGFLGPELSDGRTVLSSNNSVNYPQSVISPGETMTFETNFYADTSVGIHFFLHDMSYDNVGGIYNIVP